MTDRTGQRVMDRIRERIPAARGLELPPPVFTHLGGEFTGWEPGRSMEIRWPLEGWQRGPAGHVQGGILAAFFDNSFGPMAFLLVEGFVLTVGMDLTYVRPLTGSDRAVWIRVEPVETTRRFLFLRGEARNAAGKLVATCQTEMVRVEPEDYLRSREADPERDEGEAEDLTPPGAGG